MHAWSQWISLVLSALAFSVGFLLNPQPSRAEERRPAWRKLAAFPPFWLGLLLLVLVAVQGLNPAWQYVEFEGMFWMVPVDHIAWLPSGMETPFEQMNAFRHLLVLGSAYLTVLTVSLFLSRPRFLRVVLYVIVFNGLLLAAVGFAQILLGAEKILWIREAPHGRFLASFIYRNHGAAYFNLVLAASIGLYLFVRERGWKVMSRRWGDPGPLFFFAGLVLLTLVLFSQSRGGMVVAVVLALLALLYSIIHGLLWKRLGETVALSFVYLLLFAACAGTFVYILGWERVTERLERLTSDAGQIDWDIRTTAYQATYEMFRDKPVWGWGAGSFEYRFPVYQQEYPKIHTRWERRMRWEYAHNDPLQLLAEYGIAGAALFVALFAFFLTRIFRYRGYRRPLSSWCLLGFLVTLAHSTIDFVFHNPAVLITAVTLLAIASQYPLLEAERRRREI